MKDHNRFGKTCRRFIQNLALISLILTPAMSCLTAEESTLDGLNGALLTELIGRQRWLPLRQVNYGPGPDTFYLTADDVVLVYYDYQYNAYGKEAALTTYNAAGTDGVWFTADDVVSAHTAHTYDAQGRAVRAVAYGPGPDTVWFTADDVVTSYTTFTYFSDVSHRRTFHSGAGVDTVWFTADDVVSGYADYTQTVTGRPTEFIDYTGAGVDTIWFTADDVVNYRRQTLYDASETVTRIMQSTAAGADTVWFTGDDTITFFTVYNANGGSVKYTGSGVDLTLLTADDVLNAHNAETLDAFGNVTQRVSYNAAGVDTAWFTSDDVIGTLSRFEYTLQ